MDTILSSLNALVEKLGGDTTDNKLIVDALNDISAKYGGDSDNKLIVDALNNIVENYQEGSSGGNLNPLFHATIHVAVDSDVNTKYPGLYVYCAHIDEETGYFKQKRKSLANGESIEIPVGYNYSSSLGYEANEYIILYVNKMMSTSSATPPNLTLKVENASNSNIKIVLQGVNPANEKQMYAILWLTDSGSKSLDNLKNPEVTIRVSLA